MRIVIPVDGTPECEVSLPVAVRLAGALDADIYLVEVIDGSASAKGHVHHEPEWTGGIEPEVLVAMKKARAYLDDLVTDYGLPADRTRCLVGRSEDVAKGIITIAEKKRVDLVVISSHCRGPFGQLAQGSVCSEVVRSKVCPVLCVPLPRKQRQRERRGMLARRR